MRQQKHLRLVLLQARELAADWKIKILHFSEVHTQATHLANQYRLALQRIASEEKIHRLRAAWRARARQDPDYAADPWEQQSMQVKLANAEREVDGIQQQMAFDSPPAPPAEWTSWLSADPNPQITAPLHLAPINQEALTAPIHFTPLKLSVPPAPNSPPPAGHKVAAKKGEEKEEGEGKEGEEASFVATAAASHPMRFAQQPTARALPSSEVFAEDAKPLLKGFPGLHPAVLAKRDVTDVNTLRGGKTPIPSEAPKPPAVKLAPARDFITQHFYNSPIAAAYVPLTNSRLNPSLKPGSKLHFPNAVPAQALLRNRLNLPTEYIAAASSGIDAKYATDLFLHPLPPTPLAFHPFNPATQTPFYAAHPSYATPVFSHGFPPVLPVLPSPPLSASVW